MALGSVIYHLAPLERWEKAGEEYFPATYDQDGFVHATKDPEMLMDIANHFYKCVFLCCYGKKLLHAKHRCCERARGAHHGVPTDGRRGCRGVPGEHVVLQLDESRISHPVKYEAPAPVGSTAAPENPTLFPHIYGPVQKSSVAATLKVKRAADGSFLSFAK